jgi:hypothetical protein
MKEVPVFKANDDQHFGNKNFVGAGLDLRIKHTHPYG